MIMKARLGDYIREYSVRNKALEDIPVYSVTNTQGFCRDYFGKEVASKDKSTYKIVPKGCFAFNPSRINVGSVDWQRNEDRVIVSPLYNVFSVSPQLEQQYLYYYLKSDFALQRIRTVATGSVRDNLKLDMLYEFPIEIPDIKTQKDIAHRLDTVKWLMSLRAKELQTFDDLIKARFVEMFGDPELNPKGWEKGALKEHADVLVGYPFPSEGYSEEGINIVGGYNLMQGYVLWEDSKHWPEDTGYKQYLLQANDIVIAMDRPWVNGGFKIARIDKSHLPALLIQRTACIRSRDLEQEFLYMLLDSPRFAEHCNVTGSLVPHISNKDINSFQVILPPMNLQRQFTTFVNQVDKSKFAVRQSICNETEVML